MLKGGGTGGFSFWEEQKMPFRKKVNKIGWRKGQERKRRRSCFKSALNREEKLEMG